MDGKLVIFPLTFISRFMILHASELALPVKQCIFFILVSTKEWIKLLIILIDSDAGQESPTKEGLLSRQ